MNNVIIFIGLFVGWILSSVSASNCFCDSIDLCRPVIKSRDENKVEVYGYIRHNDPAFYNSSYVDWTRLSTISVQHIDKGLPGLVCYAHKRKVKVNYWVGFPKKKLLDRAARNAFVAAIVGYVEQFHLDGFNFDFEGIIPKDSNLTDALTTLTGVLRDRLKRLKPPRELSFAYAANTKYMHYDALNLSKIIDYFTVMYYDLNPRIFPDKRCYTTPHSPFNQLESSLKSFTNLGIPREKLVIVFPWYGYDLPCIRSVSLDKSCEYDCSISVGLHQTGYGMLMQRLRFESHFGRQLNVTSSTPYFSYQKSHLTYRVNYDDPWSISLKVQHVLTGGYRGVGMFRLDCLDNSATLWALSDRQLMWSVFPKVSNYR